MLGRLHHVVLDCPDPALLATFYVEVLEQRITYRSDDWVVVAADATSSGLAFQLAPDHRPPTWPDPAVPQQVHLDVMVEDVAAAGARVLSIGARKLDGEGVYADPAGHPFCLIRRPEWAPPIPGTSEGRDGGAAGRRMMTLPGDGPSDGPTQPGGAGGIDRQRDGYVPHMSADEQTPGPADSTVDDWLGQEVLKDEKVADEAVAEADGDMQAAEKLFDERSHRNDPEAVPAVPEADRPQ